MSAPEDGVVLRRTDGRPMPIGRRFAPGPDKRRNIGPASKAEQAFRKLLEDEFIPQAADMLRDMIADSKDPELSADTRQRVRMDFMKCCGLIRKPTDDETIQRLASELLDGMISEARARRTGEGGG